MRIRPRTGNLEIFSPCLLTGLDHNSMIDCVVAAYRLYSTVFVAVCQVAYPWESCFDGKGKSRFTRWATSAVESVQVFVLAVLTL